MAVDIKRTFYGWTDTQMIASGESVTVEGQGLVAVMEDNVEKVKPSTASSREPFVGFARFRQLSFGIGAKVEDIVVPSASPYTVELAKNNLIDGQLLVPGFTVVTTASVSGQVSVDNAAGVLTFVAADAGTAIVGVTYRWNMTVLEAKTTMYEAPVNYPDPNLAGNVGVGKGKSRIYTVHYDAAADWSTGTLKLTANGMVTMGGSGPVIPGARVVQFPTSADPFLAIEFNA